LTKKATFLRRVRSYLEPLGAQAKKWPESAFVTFTEDFLYQIAVAADFEAGVLGHAVQTVREFIPIIDAQSFRGEARFRLAEIVSLICSYEPILSDHGAYRLDLIPKPETAAQVWNLIENAEFGALVEMAGRIGYLNHPAVAYRRIRKAAKQFFTKPKTAKLFALATSAADLAGAKCITEKAKSIADLVNVSGRAAFCPPFIDLGAAQIGVYRLALSDGYVEATPPEGAILVFEHSRGGRVSHSWLNAGEELKLQKEEHDIDSSRAKLQEARLALKRFI
jgi:hypothetical protein